MAFFISAFYLILKRSLSRWQLLSAIIIGMLSAVTIMSSTVLYFDSLRNLALIHDFSTERPEDLDILIEARQATLDDDNDKKITSFVGTHIEENFGWFLTSWRSGIKSPTLFPANPNDELPPGPENRRRSTFIAIPNIEKYASLKQGRWAEAVIWDGITNRLIVEAIVPVETATIFGIKIDDTFESAPYWDASHERITARVVGIYDRVDPSDRYWVLIDTAFGLGNSGFQFAQLTVPMQTMVGGLGPYFPRMTTDYVWQLNVDPQMIRSSASARAQHALLSTRTKLRNNLNSFSLRTNLGQVLDRFDRRLFFNQVPMFVVLVLIVVVILYYISTLSGLLVDSQRTELGLLRVRGATSSQILAAYTTEAIVLTLVSIPIGPYLAAVFINTAGTLHVFYDLNAGDPIPIEITGVVFRMAALGAGVSLIALLLPAMRAIRAGITEHSKEISRPTLGTFQRYYLDIVALVVLLFLFWQLQQRGSFVAVSLFGNTVVNQISLAVPALFLVATGIVLLRLFPISMEIFGRLLSTRALSVFVPPTLVLGLWHMARSPAHHARLSFLLILTAALGVFAASFAPSLENSFRDRVYYETGADIRFLGVKSPPYSQDKSVISQTMIAQLPGVDHVTPVIRGDGSLTGTIGSSFDFLAIDPSEFLQIGWTRPDFSKIPLKNALEKLDVADKEVLKIPDDAIALYIRFQPNLSSEPAKLVVRVSDIHSRMHTLDLGTTKPTSADNSLQCPNPKTGSLQTPWCTISSQQSDKRSSSVNLEFLGVAKINAEKYWSRTRNLQPGTLLIDEIGARFQDGSTVILDDFENLEKWGASDTTLNDFGATISTAYDESGVPIQGLAQLVWGDAAPHTINGVLVGRHRQSIPSLASDSFMRLNNFEHGDEIEVRIRDRRVILKIVGTLEYFPTLDPHQAPFVVADIRSTWRALTVDSLTNDRVVSEYWASGDTDIASIGSKSLSTLAHNVNYDWIQVRSDLLTSSDMDPLSTAGWRLLLVIAFATVLLVSAFGFLTHSLVIFRRRQREFALLRAIGLSMRQMLSLVIFEQTLIIVVALTIGAFMGMHLGATIIPYLNTSGEGLRVIPPVSQQMDWKTLGVVIATICSVFIAVVLVLLTSVYRMSLHSVLRLGER